MKRFDFTKDSDNSGGSITVEHTPKKKLDLFPRIVCLIIALGIWIYMVNMNDPNSTETFTLKLDLVGATSLVTEDGTPLTVVEMDKTEVTITVKGTNRDLKTFTKGEYRATVDVSGIKKSGELTVPVKITTPANSSISLVTSGVTEVTVSVDLLVEKEIPFTIGFAEDQLPIEGYEYSILVDVDGIEFDQIAGKIKVSGPKSVIDHITAATYTVKYGEQSSKYFSVVPTYVTDSAEVIDFSRVVCPDITVTVKVINEDSEEEESSETSESSESEQESET